MSWTLIARTLGREVAGVLSGWSFSLTLRYNEVGSWTLNIPPERTPEGWPAPGAGLVFVRDGEIVASGNIDEDGFQWSAEATDDAGGQGVYTLTGDTDLARIGYRVMYPTPTAAWTAQTATHYTTSDPASTVIRRVVIGQAGSSAIAARQVPGLVLHPGDPEVGTTISIKERFTPVLDALRSAAIAGGGVAFDIRDDLAGHLYFYTWQPEDKTNVAQFGIEAGNVVSLDVKQVSPVATTALIAGAEEGTARHTLEKSDAADEAVWGRREIFVDQRQVSESATPTAEDIAEYNKAADEALDQDGSKTSVSAVIIDTPSVQWGRDYGLGDKVSVLTPYGPVADLVREVSISVDGNGIEDITSTIGTTDPATDDPLAATVRKLQKRISQLERAL